MTGHESDTQPDLTQLVDDATPALDRLRQVLGSLPPETEEKETPPPAPTPHEPPPDDRAHADHNWQEPGSATLRRGRSILGFDAGTRTLKLLHLQTAGSGIRLVNAAVYELPPPSDPERNEAISQAVADFVAEAKPGIRDAYCTLSGDGVATVCCSMPRMPEKDLAEAVRWKVAEAASVDADTAIVGYYVLDNRRKTSNQDVVAAAVPRDIHRIDTLFPGDRPRLSVVIPEPIAAENVIRAAYAGRERGPIAVLDIGCAQSTLSVVGEHGLEFTREIPVGGDTVTAALAGKMTLDNQTIEISRQAADLLKRQYTIGQSEAVQAAGLTVPATRVLGAIRPALERLASEIVRSLQFYTQSHNLARVDGLFLCGGGAALSGLARYLSDEVRVPTEVLDPWSLLGIEVDPGVRVAPALFVSATGTAIHDAARINLLPAHIKARRTISVIRTGSLVATGCALLLLAGLTLKARQTAADIRRTVQLQKEATAPMEQLAAEVKKAQALENELARRRRLLRSLGVGRPMHAAVLKELSHIMPEGTYLRSLEFENDGGVRTLSLGVDIYSMPTASSTQLKQQLITALESSPFFINVSFEPARVHAQKEDGRTPDEQLDLTCQVLGFPGD